MPWTSPTAQQRKEALLGCNNIVHRMYKSNFTVGERKFMDNAFSEKTHFFRPIENVGDADWLSNHDEAGQTFENFWRENVLGLTNNSPARYMNDGGKAVARSAAPFSARPTIPRRLSDAPAPKGNKTICILPLGPFPGDETRLNFTTEPNEFLIWLKSYCEAFFYTSKVEIFPSVSLDEVKCEYRVNQLTGRYQLKATDIIKYLKKVKPSHVSCLVAVTMIDLYPKPSWDFVFGMASNDTNSGIGGAGVFSFSRYDDVFYETWTQGSDVIKHNADGSLDYSVFSEPPKHVDGKTILIEDALFLRACKVMTHEVGHMFGMKHCIWMKCLMNGSNHLQESDARPSFLCPICLRKLQAGLGFNIMERYKALRQWTTSEFWNDYKYKSQKTAVSGRRKSLPDFARPKTVSAPKRNNHTRTKTALPGARSKTSKSAVFSPMNPLDKKPIINRKLVNVAPPPLEKFGPVTKWLDDVISYVNLYE